MENKSETIYMGCDCRSPEHIIRVSYWDSMGDDPPEVFFTLQSDGNMTFFSRVKMAFKFLFFGNNLSWNEVIPTRMDLQNFSRVLDAYHKDYQEFENN